MEKKNVKEEKSQNKIVSFLSENIISIISLFAGVLLGVAIMFIFWPSRIAELKDGTEPVATVNGKVFTADDLYNKYKEETGVSELIDLIDDYILHDKYSLEQESNDYASTQSEKIYESYNSYYGYTKAEFLSNNGFADEDEFLSYLKNEFYYQHYYDEYVGNLVTDKDITNYYNKYVFGEKHIYYFLGDSEDDLNNISKDLSSGLEYSKIAAKYTDVTSQDIESITYDTDGNYSTDVLAVIASTKKGKASKVTTDSTTSKYFLVYVVDEKETPKLEDVKSIIKDKIVDQKQNDDENLYYQAFIALREEYGLKFSDTELGNEYEATIKQYK